MRSRWDDFDLTQKDAGLNDIKCPECRHENSDNWEVTDLVTYWAEGEWIELTCDSCGYEYMVQENLRRWYEVRRKTTDD